MARTPLPTSQSVNGGRGCDLGQARQCPSAELGPRGLTARAVSCLRAAAQHFIPTGGPSSSAQHVGDTCHYPHMTCGETEDHRHSEICLCCVAFWPPFIYPFPHSLSTLGNCLSPREQWRLLEELVPPRWPHLVLRGELQKLPMGEETLRPPTGVSQSQNDPHCPLVASLGPPALQKHSLASG